MSGKPTTLFESNTNNAAMNTAAFDAFYAGIQASALKATRNAAAIPSDIAFHRSLDSNLAADVDAFSARILSLTNRLLDLSEGADIGKNTRVKGKTRLETQDDVTDNFQALVVDPMDELLERTDICLDKVLGRLKPPAIAVNPPTTTNSRSKQAHQPLSGHLDPALQHASHIVKPQLSFITKPSNDDLPWHPSITHKYNAMVPLGYTYTDINVDHEEGVSTDIKHPYHYEITHYTPPSHIYSPPTTPTPPPAIEKMPLTFVSTPDGVHAMVDKIRGAHEIAIDLEHNSYRSYNGFLCLMQISDREQDWVVDLLQPEVREELNILGEVFSDPGIVKVFHGADSDIVWLQQDFSLYIVGLFDTYHASKVLEFPRHGLANLLEMYCDYIPDKRYQLADWRIRPLPQEMLDYARSDTHFLLYIYDNLRNALIDRATSRSQSPVPSAPSPPTSVHIATGLTMSKQTQEHTLINHVLARSAETALRTYSKELYDATGGSGSGGWDTLAKRWNRVALCAGAAPSASDIMTVQREVYKAVHAWREVVGRAEDESVRYVLPNHYLFQLAEHPPADMAAMLRLFRTTVPPIIRQRATELLDVIKKGVRSGLQANEVTGTTKEVITSGRMENVLSKEPIGSKTQEDNVHTRQVLKSSNNSGLSPPTLFGSSMPSEHTRDSQQNTINIRIPFSTLFGDVPIVPMSHKTNPHFLEVVSRISSTLIIAPAAPQVISPGFTTDPQLKVTKAEGTTETQVEIPYVPLAQRRTTTSYVGDKDKDTIVVVGQARQKKRKRTKVFGSSEKQVDEGGETTDTKSNPKARGNEVVKEEVIEEKFDFAAVPNVLDENPAMDDRKKKRQRKTVQNRGRTYYGDFPAPPKAHSELKSGNQSHTFK